MLSQDGLVLSGKLVVLYLHGLGMGLVDVCGCGMWLGALCSLGV